MSAYEIATITVAIVAIIVPVFITYRPQRIPFKLIRRDSQVKEPFQSKIAIEVSHPDKTIEKCRVFYNGHILISEESKKTEVTIFAQGSALFRIPIGKEDEEAKIVVKNGRHTLRKEKLKDLELSFKPWAKYIDW
jgi:hypothetical protein